MKEKITFLELFRKFIKHHSTTKDEYEKRDSITIGTYNNKYLVISGFLSEQKLIEIPAIDVRISLAKALFSYIIELGCSRNTAVRYAGMMRQVMKYGAGEEIIPYDPLSGLLLKKTPPKEPPYYEPYKVKLWEDYTSASTMKQKAADMFVFQLHTGVDYGDFKEITEETIKVYLDNVYLVKIRNKNRNNKKRSEAIIPLSKIAQDLLVKHNYGMRLLSNPVYNKTIKEIAAELGLDPVKCKDARKLALGHKLNNEMYSLEATSKIAGHKSITTTQAFYVNVKIDRINTELEKLKPK